MTKTEEVARLARQIVNGKKSKKFEKRSVANEVTTNAHKRGILTRPPGDELEIQRLGVLDIVNGVLHKRDQQDRRVFLAFQHGGTWFWQHSRFVPLKTLYSIRADYDAQGRRIELRRDGVQTRIDQLEDARHRLGLGEDITLEDVGEAGV